MSQLQKCLCANRNCFHEDCACFTREGVCSEYCECHGDCKNIWKHEEEVTEEFAEYTKRKADEAAAQAAAAQAAAAQPAADQAAAAQAAAAQAAAAQPAADQAAAAQAAAAQAAAAQPAADQAAAAQAAAAQAAAAQAAAQPQPKPLPAQEPESKGEARNNSPSAVKMNWCSCRTSGCRIHRCPCFMHNAWCSSKCNCAATVCVNRSGAKGALAEKLQHRGIKREVLASGSVTSTATAGAVLANEGGKGCTCLLSKCTNKKCGCLNRGARCTLKCSCQGCENGKGTGGADKSNAGAGGTGGTGDTRGSGPNKQIRIA
ncbi:hypothetical protein CFC21_009364 [Triticum aestivum]|uniref:CRC domain-containing protein n=2 Tax=Triticum aestivum TaxID=4565 RepID=A0A9R1DI98_WHEAT|nr:protein tesmin/TSO1-like CXC 5 [Triticum aestivum]KAF6992366.1 hypothetical protein CFC21_009364 [Triticum aestivum]